MSNFQEYLNEQLKNSAFQAEWEALETECLIKKFEVCILASGKIIDKNENEEIR